MKSEVIHPEINHYNFDLADTFVEYGQKNNMYIVGHTLVWHNQTPVWFFQDENGKPKSKEAVAERLHEHIKTVAGRYSGKVAACGM